MVGLASGRNFHLSYASILHISFGLWEIPSWVKEFLRFVPPAVLSALIVPELFMQSGKVFISLGNIRLLAGIAAIFTALLTKNTLLTILTGIVFVFIFNTF